MYTCLKYSGYSNIILSFQQQSKSRIKQQQHRNTAWFNQAFSSAIITNVAKTFLQPLYQHFHDSGTRFINYSR